MSCKTPWDLEFVAENTDEKFHNVEYRDHRAKILLSTERSLLPATQPFVIEEIAQREVQKDVKELNENIKKCDNFLRFTWPKISRYRKMLARRRKLPVSPDNNAMIAKIQRRLAFINSQRNECQILKSSFKEELMCLNYYPEKVVKEEKTSIRFIGHCPQDECKGYLDSKYVCGLCEQKACRSCRQPMHTGEECDKDIVATVKMLAADTKSCPNCGVPIYKISGCSQMYHVECRTAFDWETGQIVHGRIHNPHFYEWQRKHGGAAREAGDVRCGGPVDFGRLIHRVRSCGYKGKWLERPYMLSGHIREIVLPKYRLVDNMNVNRDLRVKYLIGDYTEKRWLSEIKRREKKREKTQAIGMVLTMLADTIDDLLGNILTCNPGDIALFFVQLKELRVYTCMNLTKIEKRFQNKVPQIDEKWNYREVGERVSRNAGAVH
jgi:hypothetical protein